jgi:inhibitor of KinA sporulation pathway (predicted exonuclease)
VEIGIYEQHYRGMKTMLKQSHLILEGKHHSGIDDTKNIARIAQWLIQNKKMLELTLQENKSFG